MAPVCGLVEDRTAVVCDLKEGWMAVVVCGFVEDRMSMVSHHWVEDWTRAGG